MKTLYLMRHAHAEAAAPPPLTDHERILSLQGEAETAAAASFLASRGTFPSFVLSSTSLRAVQTVRGIYASLLTREGLRVASHIDRALYLAPATLLLEHIAHTNGDMPCLLVIAHNPGIAELAQALNGGPLPARTAGFPPAAIAAFRVEARNWYDLSPATVRLETVFVP